MSIYKGFSTLVNAKKYTLTDFELVKRDLMNNFNIRKGEKLMQPEFGTIIWNMLFEPLTEDTQQAISDDIKRIVSYDPRLRVGSIQVLQQTNGFLVQLTLAFVPTNQVETLALNFDQAQTKLTVASSPN